MNNNKKEILILTSEIILIAFACVLVSYLAKLTIFKKINDFNNQSYSYAHYENEVNGVINISFKDYYDKALYYASFFESLENIKINLSEYETINNKLYYKVNLVGINSINGFKNGLRSLFDENTIDNFLKKDIFVEYNGGLYVSSENYVYNYEDYYDITYIKKEEKNKVIYNVNVKAKDGSCDKNLEYIYENGIFKDFVFPYSICWE